MIGTWVLITIFTWITNGFHPFFDIAIHFLSGDLKTVESFSTTTATAPIVTAAVVVLVPLVIAVVALLSKYSSTQPDEDINHTKKPELQFAQNMAILIGEELFARFFFLGIIKKIPILDSTIAFFGLLIIGNGIWAALHLMTLEKEERKWFMVIPQFLGGIFFSMIYVSHGFFAALMTLIIYDIVLFSTYRKTLFEWNRFKYLCFYHLMWFIGGMIWFLVVNDRLLSEIWRFFTISPHAIPCWGSADYLLTTILLLSAASLLLEFLWYDREQESAITIKRNILLSTTLLFLSYPVIIGVETHFPGNFFIKITCIAALMVSLERTNSSSGVDRLFWKSLLVAKIFSIMQFLDLVSIIWMTILFLLYQAGERVTRYGYFFRPVRYALIPQRVNRLLEREAKSGGTRSKKQKNDFSPKLQFFIESQTTLLKIAKSILEEENLSPEEKDFYLRGSLVPLLLLKKANKIKE
jgi:hypothetical protein